MIKNYLKVALRNLMKSKAHTFINIIGLSIGLACSLLILLWVQNELSVDSFYKNDNRLYTLYERQYTDHKVQGQYYTPGNMADEIKKVIPEVEYASPLGYSDPETFQVGDKMIKISGNAAGEDFFKIFSYPIIQGNAQTALNSPVSIAISRKMADDFYGSPQNAIGKIIHIQGKKNYTITTIFENLPSSASQKFEFLLNWSAFLEDNPWAKSWGTNYANTYIMLRADAKPLSVEKKLTHFLDAYNTDQKKGSIVIELGMQKFSDGYLHSTFVNGKFEGGRIEYVHLFSIVALFILLIACVNFMNLTTARSIKRAKEIGVRKVIGAMRATLIRQFIGEALFVASLAVIVALIILTLLLPSFNQITNKQIELPFANVLFWLKLILITAITGLISGSYPAFFLSSFNPIKVLKGVVKVSSVAMFRKGLVVFQFVLSLVFIIGAIVISKQVNYIQTKNLGYDRENLIYIPLEGDLGNKYKIFKDEASKMPGIQSISLISNDPTNINNATTGVNWDGKDPNQSIEFTQASVGYDFVGAMKLKLLNGRDFSPDFATDSTSYIINETALKRIGYTNPIGKSFTQWGKKGKIIGVLKDFHFNSLHDQINPLVIRLAENVKYGNILVRAQPGQTKQALSTIEKLSKELNPNYIFSYTFSEEEYQKLYSNEQTVGKLSNAFAFLAIFISSMGLLGLSMFTAEQRIKEIGIRKVLGASIGSIFSLLSSEFILLILIAIFIAAPIAWYVINNWLQGFAYHINIQWWMFIMSSGLILLISLITVSFQAIKSALINPVKSLRSE